MKRTAIKSKCANRCGEYASFSVPMGKAFCSMSCCTSFAAKVVRKEKQVIIVREKKDTAARRSKLQSISAACSEAQKDVNAMIRAADIKLGFRCIASGAEISDGGHFYHAGSKYRVSWLRFLPSNIHGQGSKSNRYPSSEEKLDYLEGLENRYGTDYIKDLKEFKRMEDHGLIPAPTKEEVKAMAKWCRAMTRIYKSQS